MLVHVETAVLVRGVIVVAHAAAKFVKRRALIVSPLIFLTIKYLIEK
jgi:hypothetical protein